MKKTLIMAAILLWHGSAGAKELIFGLGPEDVTDRSPSTNGVAGGVEYRFDPFGSLGPVDFTFGIAGEIGAGYWGGAGVVALWPIDERFRLGVSVMPGLYNRIGDRRDLGGPFEIRSQIAFDYKINSDVRIGLAFEHKSNADIYDKNYGIETLFFTVSSSF